MGRQSQILDWHFLDEAAFDEEARLSFASASQQAANGSMPIAPDWRSWQMLTIPILVLLLSMAGWLWWQANAGLTQLRAELSERASLDLWNCVQDSQIRVRNLQILARTQNRVANCPLWVAGFVEENGASVQIVIDDVKLTADQAIVHLLIRTAGRAVVGATGQATNFRAMAFYRQTNEGWRPVVLDGTIRGPLQPLETTFFRFRASQREMPVMEPIAATLDETYLSLRDLMGLAPPPLRAGHNIRYVPSGAPSSGNRLWPMASGRNLT